MARKIRPGIIPNLEILYDALNLFENSSQLPILKDLSVKRELDERLAADHKLGHYRHYGHYFNGTCRSHSTSRGILRGKH